MIAFKKCITVKQLVKWMGPMIICFWDIQDLSLKVISKMFSKLELWVHFPSHNNSYAEGISFILPVVMPECSQPSPLLCIGLLKIAICTEMWKFLMFSPASSIFFISRRWVYCDIFYENGVIFKFWKICIDLYTEIEFICN